MIWPGSKYGVDRASLAVLVGLPLVAGLVLGANQTRAGAFMPWLGSIAYWIAISFATWLLIAAATWLVDGVLRPWHPPRWLVWLAGAIVGSVAARPTIYTVTDLFRPLMQNPVLREMRPWRFDWDFLGHYITNWSLIIAMWVLSCALATQWRRREQSIVNSDTGKPSGADRPAELHGLLRRLSPSLGKDIVAVQAEDHYVRIFTKLGNELMLGSLSDAINDLNRSGIGGQRTHRSWWVADNTVSAQNQRGRQVVLQLCNGIEAPVSVTYRQTALAGGLLVTRDAM